VSNHPRREAKIKIPTQAARVPTFANRKGGPATTQNHPSPLYTVNSYNALGEVVTDTLGNGINRTFAYDNRGRFLSHTDTLSGSTKFAAYAWYYPNSDVAGTSITDQGNWEFTYDDFNRLSASCQPASTCVSTPSSATAAFNYTYDPSGNRWTQSIPPTCSGCTGPQPQYNFDAKNRITTASGIIYDAAGNVINDGTHTYSYDAENRMITVDGSTQTYFYDAFGRQTQTIYGGNTYSRIFGLNGRAEVQFVGNTWMLSELYAGSTGEYLGNYSNNTTYFAHSDHEDTRHKYTDPNGSVVETCTSLPFGDGANCTGSGPASPTAFTGQDLDPNTNLTRFLARNYSMQQGRWLSPDPSGLAAVDVSNPQTWNRYAYVANNPLSFVDPTGLNMKGPGNICDAGGVVCGGGGDDGEGFSISFGYGGGNPDGFGGGGFSFSFDFGGLCSPNDYMPCGLQPTDPTVFSAINDILYGRIPGFPGIPTMADILNPMSDGFGPANNGTQPLLTPNQQKALHCLGQTVKAKGLSIGLDVAGSIPGFGNLFSGAAAGIQGLNAAYYGTVSLANAGNTLLNPSVSGAANTAATAGFAVASLALSGSKAIPVVGTIVSLGFLAYDVAGPGGAISTYQQCMAGPG
jgi:RHS repeat-associated protein